MRDKRATLTWLIFAPVSLFHPNTLFSTRLYGDVWPFKKQYQLDSSRSRFLEAEQTSPQNPRNIANPTSFPTVLHVFAKMGIEGCYRGSISSGASLFSPLLEEMAHIIQTTDDDQLQCLMIEFAPLPVDEHDGIFQ
jgi:hypothetical protein